jgi:hypothetical protein
VKRLKFTLWAIGNFTLAAVLIPLFWAASALNWQLVREGVWSVVVVLVLVLPVGTVMWPLWILGQGLISVALMRRVGHEQGRLAYLSWDRYGPTIELVTSHPSVVRWHRLGLAALLPGWGGYAAAVLLTASGGLALAGQVLLQWPLWASILFGLGWVAGWFWYVTEVRRKVRRRR